MKKVNILETTLRDGNYAIDFQFMAGDTALIAAEFEKVGFDLIEIGHGVGLHASESGKIYDNGGAWDKIYGEESNEILQKMRTA
jgi:hypothetical protein